MRNNATLYTYLTASCMRLFRLFTILICGLLVVGCDRYDAKPRGLDDVKSSLLSGFTVAPNGTALSLETGLTWYRCLAGTSFKAGSCQGSAFQMNWAEANRFAADLTEKSSVNWRLATQKELQAVIQPDCNDPALNIAVFNNIGAVNLWTGTSSWKHRSDYACTIYSYNGALSCKQPKASLHPFLLVTEQGAITR